MEEVEKRTEQLKEQLKATQEAFREASSEGNSTQSAQRGEFSVPESEAYGTCLVC